MTLMKLTALALQVLMGFIFSLTYVSASQDVTSNPNKLAEVFSPLSWTTTRKEIPRLFPRAKIQDTTATDGEKSTLIYGLSSTKMGDHNIHIVWREQRISKITLSSDERREQCAPGGNSRPKSCRNVYGTPLQKLLGELKRELERKHGPPQVNPIISDHRAKEPQVSYGWTLPTAKILLTMFADEEDLWSVSITAHRVI